jgi:putative component of toxin-antitoxin plasmid stabilization module
MKNIENKAFYHAIYKKLRRMPYKSIDDLKACRKGLKQVRKESENNMKQYLSQNTEKIDSTKSGLGNKKATLSYDYSSIRDIDVEEGEEFKLYELENSELLPRINSK